jgi:D-glycero-alpha-D-manno-heptose-7-phosphate kinase
MMAIDIERRVLKEVVGVQDQFAVAHGGFNKITFSTKGNISIKNVDMKPKFKKILFENLLLVFTGVSRKSSIIAKKQLDKIKYNKNRLTNITQITNEAINIFESNKNIDQIGHLMHESWLQKKELSPFISSDLIDEMYNSALNYGALGGKIIGAGGGGFLLLYINKEKKAILQKLFKKYIQVPIIPENEGSKIIFNGYS